MTTDTPWSWIAAHLRRGTESVRRRRCTLLATEEYSGAAPGGYHASLGAARPAAPTGAGAATRRRHTSAAA